MIDLSQVDLDAIAAEMVRRGAPKDNLALLNRKHNQALFDLEHCKDHPSAHLELPPEKWAEEKAHYLDGGGVEDANLALDDGRTLAQRAIEALDANNQKEFHRLKSHIFKVFLRASGLVRSLPNGGVVRGAHGNPALAAARVRHRAEFAASQSKPVRIDLPRQLPEPPK